MERLTIKQDEEYYIKTLNDDCTVCASCERCEKHINQLVKILGAYEDTGLTPEILMEYKKFEDELVLKHNIRFNEAIERIEKYPQLQKENAELKKEVKLWEQGREVIANQAKLVEKVSCENAKKYFEEKAENTELKELLKLVASDVFIADDCEICSDKEECMLRETFNGHCGFWQWQHADKLKELGVE